MAKEERTEPQLVSQCYSPHFSPNPTRSLSLGGLFSDDVESACNVPSKTMLHLKPGFERVGRTSSFHRKPSLPGLNVG